MSTPLIEPDGVYSLTGFRVREKPISAEEYLRQERASTSGRREWIDGRTRDVAGASPVHMWIVENLVYAISKVIDRKAYRVGFHDFRVQVPEGAFYYPDIVVYRTNSVMRDDDSRDTLLNPLVVFEVLSPSTLTVDRVEKLEGYRRIPSVTDYLLVSQTVTHIEHYRREPGASDFDLKVLPHPEEVVELDSIGVSFRVDAAYENMD
ncbi:MAG: Uma2 family endonuclease [Planctomycetota bacterium]